jgi:hypothetical protein
MTFTNQFRHTHFGTIPIFARIKASMSIYIMRGHYLPAMIAIQINPFRSQTVFDSDTSLACFSRKFLRLRPLSLAITSLTFYIWSALIGNQFFNNTTIVGRFGFNCQFFFALPISRMAFLLFCHCLGHDLPFVLSDKVTM